MSYLVPVTSVGPVGFAPVTTAAAPAQAAGLLPAPSSAQPSVGDAINALLQMSSQISEQQMQLGKSQVQAAEGQRKIAAERRKEVLDRAIEAARKAREAQEDGGGLFSFITDNVGVAGLIGLATFNWGLVAADITAHQAELTSNNTNLMDLGAAVFGGPLGYLAMEGLKKYAPDELGGQAGVTAALLGGPMGYALERAAEKMMPEDLGKDVEKLTTVKDDDVRMANKIALMVAMAAVAATSVVLSGGTSTPAVIALVGIGISTTTQIAAETGALKEICGEKAAVYVALGGAITGAALTLGGSAWSAAAAFKSAGTTLTAAQGAAKATVSAVNAGKSIADGTASVVAGVRELDRAGFQHDADLANADAEEARHVLKRIEKAIDDILEDLKEAKDSAQRSAEILNSTLQTHNQTLLQAASIKV